MDIHKLAAFSSEGKGGNPAGVAIVDEMPDRGKMQAIAFDIGYSETVFAKKLPEKNNWRVRYFSPETEVPFCGHATIALAAHLAEIHQPDLYDFVLNDLRISVSGFKRHDEYGATLTAPVQKSRNLSFDEISDFLDLFSLSKAQLNLNIHPAFINAGADHQLFVLKSRQDLAAMDYELDEGRSFMRERGLVTIMLAWMEDDQTFHCRNAFASGGVFEDPATGAAAAAFAGYLKQINWNHGGRINIIQGEDMGMKSRITANITDDQNGTILISGTTRKI